MQVVLLSALPHHFVGRLRFGETVLAKRLLAEAEEGARERLREVGGG